LVIFDYMKELLVSLSHYPFDPFNRNLLKELLNRVEDWERTVTLINEHGIIALAAYNIKEAGLEGEIPGYAMKLLDNGRRQTIIRNAWLNERWKEVNNILNNEGIRHVLLKGMALEHSVYNNQGIRQMSDNDILVKREQALKAWYLLQQHGFQSELLKSSLFKNIIIETGKHLPSLTKEGYTVEIHHRLFKESAANESLSDAIDNALEIDIGGTRGYILRKDIHHNYLNEHLLQHMAEGESQLRLYADLEALKPGSAPEIPCRFIERPRQPATSEQRKNSYRNEFFSVSSRHRLRFLAGDLFPSVRWMKKRYKCSTYATFIYYPGRLGKMLWLLGSI
jgi:hypothetical protein